MNNHNITLNENEAIELIAYILTSAQGLLKEPPDYAVLRMVSVADRMARLWAPRSEGNLAEFLDDLSNRMPVESARTQGGDMEAFNQYLSEKITELAQIVKQRDIREGNNDS